MQPKLYMSVSGSLCRSVVSRFRNSFAFVMRNYCIATRTPPNNEPISFILKPAPYGAYNFYVIRRKPSVKYEIAGANEFPESVDHLDRFLF